MSAVISSVRRSRHGAGFAAAARLGLGARGFVYLMIGWLALQIAFGHSSQQANQRGALAEVARHRFGTVLLWILGVGFAAYALWRWSEAAFGTAAEGDKPGPRVQSLVRGVVYAFFAVSTLVFIAGKATQGQSQQQETTTAKLMKHPGGRWLVGLAGLLVVGVGLVMIVDGVRRKFENDLRMHEITAATRTALVRLGMIGTIARGAVFAVTGALVVDAARTYDPSKSTGLDGALRTLARHSYGSWLLTILALGLIAFGIYGLAAARWAKT